ncbi:Uncharacterized protein Adt_45576 [Abeliophyllum distichum]|uniref:Uncharacterized protein n=1 Tax=Abeliophyllum distichum TaxID=126358 RepID=A0ABD1PE17_9LAMI
MNPKDHVKAITTRSGVQLPEIHVKRPVVDKENVLSTNEEHEERTEQTIDISIKERSCTPQVKKTVPINPYEPSISFFHRLQKHKLDKQFAKIFEIFKKLHINILLQTHLLRCPVMRSL